ncbi:Acid shock protein OS=Afipia felis OX=1035 GN=NCTC12722_01557 PE=4 SV=1 [Afipia felis]
MKRQGYLAACLAAAALVTMPAASVFAQGMPTPGFQLGGGKQMSPEEKERQDRLEKAARDAQSKIPDQKANNDPWASVRSSETSAPKAGHKASGSKTVR